MIEHSEPRQSKLDIGQLQHSKAWEIIANTLLQKPDPEQWQAMHKELERRKIDYNETNQDTFSEEINERGFEGLPRQGREDLLALSVVARSYWTGYIVKDHFEKDDSARRAFRSEMVSLFPCFELLNAKSKLRASVQTGLYQTFRRVVADLDTAKIHTSQADKVRELYGSLFPIHAVGTKGGDADKMRKLFPSFPPVDEYRPAQEQGEFAMVEITELTEAQRREIFEHPPKIPAPTYRAYFLDLTEGQRLEIVANFDKAAHDFLELVTTAPAAQASGPLAEKTNT